MNAVEALRAVPWLSSLSPAEMTSLAERSERVTFAPGKEVMAELEVGERLYVVIEGTAQATVAAGGGERRVVGTLEAGDACGEISLLTQELHSATVTAQTALVVFCWERRQFEELIQRHPAVLAPLAQRIAARIVDTDAALEALGAHPAGSAAEDRLRGRSAAVVPTKGSFSRAWRELIRSRRRELPVLALAAFMGTLASVRLGAFALERAGVGLFDFLRAAYLLGIGLVFVSTATALVWFRPAVQKAVALLYGVGFALLLNELSVFLAFDTFYLDMTTPDPTLVFSVESLYRRRESIWAVWLMAAFLAQLVLLRPFYRRSAFVLRARLLSTLRRPTGKS